MSRIAERRCLCCGVEYLRGCVIGQCSNNCDYDWCRKCTKCSRHCKCAEGFQAFFGYSCAQPHKNPEKGTHE